MRKTLSLIAALTLFSLMLAEPSKAEQVWVRNKPFPGVVRGSGSNIMVELEVFVALLEIRVEDQGDTIVIGGFPIPVEKSGSVRLVPLRDVVDAAGLKISQNPVLDTIDVRMASAGTGHRGNWSNLSEQTSSGSERGTSTKLGGATFSVQVPARLKVVVEQRYLQSEESESVKVGELNPVGQQSGAETMFMVSTSKGPESGLFTATLLPDLPAEISPQDELEYVNRLKNSVLLKGGELNPGASRTHIGGKSFHIFRYSMPQQSSEATINEVFVHFSTKHRVAFLFQLSAPAAQFHQTAPQLRLVTRNFRIK